MIAILLSALLAPPVPPPPAEPLEAAMRLWEDHPLPETIRQGVIDALVSDAAYNALGQAKVKPTDRDWAAKLERMRARIRAHVPADRREVDRQVVACLADSVARHLTAEEIEAVRRFASTPAGTKFWDIVARPVNLSGCYEQAIRLWPTPEDYLSAGLRPPKPKVRQGDIVS
jgi:hypothetical protein